MVLPNQLTTLRIILTPVFVYMFLSEDPVLKQISLAVFFIAAITDWYDGWLARKFNYITTWGKFMDPLADKILTSAALFSFVYLGILELWMVVAVVIRDVAVTALRLFAEWKGKSFITSKMAKVKTFTQMVFLFYLIIIFSLKENDYLKQKFSGVIEILTNRYFVYYTMLAITLFTVTTGIVYIYQNRLLIKSLFVGIVERN